MVHPVEAVPVDLEAVEVQALEGVDVEAVPWAVAMDDDPNDLLLLLLPPSFSLKFKISSLYLCVLEAAVTLHNVCQSIKVFPFLFCTCLCCVKQTCVLISLIKKKKPLPPPLSKKPSLNRIDQGNSVLYLRAFCRNTFELQP